MQNLYRVYRALEHKIPHKSNDKMLNCSVTVACITSTMVNTLESYRYYLKTFNTSTMGNHCDKNKVLLSEIDFLVGWV